MKKLNKFIMLGDPYFTTPSEVLKYLEKHHIPEDEWIVLEGMGVAYSHEPYGEWECVEWVAFPEVKISGNTLLIRRVDEFYPV